MATASLHLAGISRVNDVSRFLELLDMVGIDSQSGHPLQVANPGELIARIGVDDLTLLHDNEGSDEDAP